MQISLARKSCNVVHQLRFVNTGTYSKHIQMSGWLARKKAEGKILSDQLCMAIAPACTQFRSETTLYDKKCS